MIRLVMVLPMWIMAFQGNYFSLGYSLLFVMLTDFLDGLIARIFNQTSRIGEKLDSIADHVILISAIIWLVVFKGDIFVHRIYVVLAVLLYIVMIIVVLVKTNTFGGAHLLESKPFALFGYVFIVQAMFGYYYELVFFLAFISWILHSSVNILNVYRPDLFDNPQRSIILKLSGREISSGPFKYFF
jgi:phosphatidylglycerophosphate synthase